MIERVMMELDKDEPNKWLIPGAIESAVREAIDTYENGMASAMLIHVIATYKKYSNGNFVDIVVTTNEDVRECNVG